MSKSAVDRIRTCNFTRFRMLRDGDTIGFRRSHGPLNCGRIDTDTNRIGDGVGVREIERPRFRIGPCECICLC